MVLTGMGPYLKKTPGGSALEVPEIANFLADTELVELQNSIDPLRESTNNGIDIYMETIQFVIGKLESREQ